MLVQFHCPEASPPCFQVPILESRRPGCIVGQTHSVDENMRLQCTDNQHTAAPRGVLVRGLDGMYQVSKGCLMRVPDKTSTASSAPDVKCCTNIVVTAVDCVGRACGARWNDQRTVIIVGARLCAVLE